MLSADPAWINVSVLAYFKSNWAFMMVFGNVVRVREASCEADCCEQLLVVAHRRFPLELPGCGSRLDDDPDLVDARKICYMRLHEHTSQ